ncbi:polymerase [Pokkaliibacter plantistimulans]|uniref:Polymerase n=1 Tax=Proteobacteria bacterium 228 TaxID=2083153 RepID=A0A2S5KSQ2_9PROT|nr:O-antigen ligase family protein [Pokkaliibacter plantistimulans]PPC77702.1 polymerase [Pokkaliibacter plantistimulans]
MLMVMLLGAALVAGCLLTLLGPDPQLAPLLIPALAAFGWLYKRPVWGLIAVITVVPFEGALGIDISANKLLAPLILIVGLRLILQHQPAHALRSNLWPVLIGFLVCYGFSVWKSEFRPAAIPYLYDLSFALGCFVCTLMLCQYMNLQTLFRFVAAGVAITCLVAIQTAPATDNGRATGFLADPNYYALIIDVAFAMVMMLILNTSSPLQRAIWGVIMLILVSGLLHTESRSGMLVMMLIVLSCLWNYRTLVSRLQPKHFGFVLLGLMIGAGVALKAMPEKYFDRFASLAALSSGATPYEDPSLGRRASYLVVGANIVEQHPLLGTGPGTFPINYAQSSYAVAFSYMPDRSDLFRVAHNTYMQMVSEIGVPGGLLFVLAIVIGLRNFYQARRNFLRAGNSYAANIAAHAGLGLLAVAIFLLFLTDPASKYLWFLLGLSSYLYRESNTPAITTPPLSQPLLPRTTG